ncbi:MAG TPA: glycoside hydrolase family 25 protein [Actinomycetota bacterium]|nr:glycoside hydrolase family 25 protein [Actinomycetota bacterium]
MSSTPWTTASPRAARVCAFVAACALLSAVLPSLSPPRARAQTTYTLGIDVSHHQGVIDWNQVAQSGHVFVFHKATEGATNYDVNYTADRTGATAAGLRWGAYHFARPDGATLEAVAADARAEAAHFLAIAQPVAGDLLPVLDLEATGGLSPELLIAWTQAWLDDVKVGTGSNVLIYTSPNFWRTSLADTLLFAQQGFPLWLAHFTSAAAPSVPAANWNGGGWTFWQWTDCATVPGVAGCVDEDRFSGSDLAAFTISSTTQPSASPTPSATASASPTPTTTSSPSPAQSPSPTSAPSSSVSPSASPQPTPTADKTAPAAPRMTRPDAKVASSRSIDVAWTHPESDGITFDVRYRAADLTSGFGSSVSLVRNTRARSSDLRGDAGHNYCFSARATDAAGNTSEWSSARCTAVPLDDRDLASTSRWVEARSREFYGGTFTEARSKGQNLTTGKVRTRKIFLLAQQCSGCGKVSVFLNDKLLRTIDLRAVETVTESPIRVARFPSPRRGTLAIVVVSDNKPVRIDGVVFSL